MGLLTKHGRGMGWRPDKPDHRDFMYRDKRFKIERVKLPPKFSVDHADPPIWDQGSLGSCTSHGIAAALEFDRIKQKLKVFTPSRLFIYYNERLIEGSVNEDAGAEIRDGIKSVASHGYAEEYLWPYDISKFTIKPNQQVYQNAQKFKALSYFRLNNGNLIALKTCIAAGYPFVFGCTLYDSFYQADMNKGIVPMPGMEEPIGGHCMLAVGYDDATERFMIRNSWGTGVGDKGYYYMPYKYLTNTNLSDDFWTIRSVI